MSFLCEARFSSNRDSQGVRRKTIPYKNTITLSVIGCVVNGPGEAAMTDVDHRRKKGNNMLYLSGVQSEKF